MTSKSIKRTNRIGQNKFSSDPDQIRATFRSLDRKNKDQIREWFLSHVHLSTNDISQIVDLAAPIIRELRRFSGLKQTGFKTPAKYTPIRVDTVVYEEGPPDWKTNIEWLKMMLEKFTVSQIARIVKRDRKTVYDVLDKHNLKSRGNKAVTKSTNPHCTKEWCHHHYVVLNYNQGKCAELAGISQQTFASWLNRFKIPVRSRKDAVIIPVWQQALVHSLKINPTVNKVFVRNDHIHVRFKDYYWESYHDGSLKVNKRHKNTFFKITPRSARIAKIPLVHYEYDVDITGKPLFPAHIAINRNEYNNSSFVEKRLALHEFARQIVTRGWVWPSFPDEILKKDYEKLRNSTIEKFIENDHFTAVPRFGKVSPPGRYLMMHYFDTKQFWRVLQSPKYAVKFLNIMANESNVKINLFNLLLTLASENDTPRKLQRFHDPGVYYAIFRQLQIKGTILDLDVGCGNRTLACAAAGLGYTTPDDMIFDAVDRGLVEFTGLNYKPYSGEKVDMLVYDEGWGIPNMAKLARYIPLANRVMVFAPAIYRNSVMKYNPKSAIKIRTHLYRNAHGYIFVW